MEKLQKRNNTIDLLRFLTCPFILLIHCPLPGLLGDVIIHIGRYGVPFFLLVSGWFSYIPDTHKMTSQTNKKLIDTLKLMGSFAITYLIMNSVTSLLSGEMLFSWIGPYVTLGTLGRLILFNRALFWGSTGYYVFMLFYVYVIFLILIRFNLLNKAFFLVPILLIVNVLCGAFTDLPWFCYGNFLFTGLPFFLLGHWLHKFHKHLPQKTFLWIFLFVFGVILTLAEAYWNKAAYCYCGSIIMAIALLILAVNHNIEHINPVIVQVLQRYSIYIFVIHCGVRNMIQAFVERQNLMLTDYAFVSVIVLVTLLISIVWDLLAVYIKYHRRLDITT